MSRTRARMPGRWRQRTMARPRPDLPKPAAIRALCDAEGRLALRVTPGARTDAVELGEGKLLLKVRARPDRGEANEAVLTLLAQALGIPRSRVRLLRGATSREKQVCVS